jgi:flavin-dependent dehydrogenase
MYETRIYDNLLQRISNDSNHIKGGMKTHKTDVLIIGGGPAGTTFGSLMKKRGWDVTLLEKDHHPRFHIGESLLPMNLPILERLGVLDEVRVIGVPKLGADFTMANSNATQKTFRFSVALGESPDHAFEVRRSDFDRILFERCRQTGVCALEGMRVQNVGAIDHKTHTVEAKDAEGKSHVWKTRFLVDASGRDTFLSSANGWKKRNPRHASAAIFSHFRGVRRRAGKDQGNISIYWFDHGWIWMIPLQDDIMSIGAVCYPEHFRTRSGSLDEFLLGTLEGLTETKQRMEKAEAIMPAQATGNYSYLSDRMCGPGYLLVGDAFAFIDPVFSSGVYLAMSSAERGIRVAEAWLNGSHGNYRKACRQYQREIQRGISIFSWFIYRFTSPVMVKLMSNPRNTFQIAQAMISMLAGDVFSNRKVRRRLLVFKAIYSVSWLLNWREAYAARKIRLANLKSEAQRPAA